MKIKSTPIILSAIVLVTICIAFYACENFITVDCDECYANKPDSADLEISLSFDKAGDSIPIKVFDGHADANHMVFDGYAYESPAYVYVKVGKLYSVEATYYSENDTIVVVDGTTIKTTYVSEECSDDCYVVRKNEINAKLKY